MKALPANVVPTFMNGAGIGSDFGQLAPQIKFFDVYYINLPGINFTVAIPPDEGCCNDYP